MAGDGANLPGCLEKYTQLTILHLCPQLLELKVMAGGGGLLKMNVVCNLVTVHKQDEI